MFTGSLWWMEILHYTHVNSVVLYSVMLSELLVSNLILEEKLGWVCVCVTCPYLSHLKLTWPSGLCGMCRWDFSWRICIQWLFPTCCCIALVVFGIMSLYDERLRTLFCHCWWFSWLRINFRKISVGYVSSHGWVIQVSEK